jgi:CheY-like chemotaxis protein
MELLVVDDDQGFTEDLAEICPPDVQLTIAHGTNGAFKLLQRTSPDAVVLDLKMAASLAADPAHEGLAALGAITGGYLGEIPVIIVTESCSACAREWCFRLGARRVLEKSNGLSRIIEAARAVAVANARKKP